MTNKMKALDYIIDVARVNPDDLGYTITISWG
jgi:hypothetical protein